MTLRPREHIRPPRVEVGDVLDGRYQIVRDLGRGAAGIVFEARHLYTGRFVALKMVLPDAHPESAVELGARLQREGRAIAAVSHPGVVQVLDGGVTVDGAPYLVMEMLSGRTLEGLVASRGHLPVLETAGLTLQLCDALDAVHRAGVVHRDVKPANVIVVREVDGREQFKLVDFGVARISDTSEEKLTSIGAVLGTPAYMSPEQLLAQEEVDAASDVYSLGAMMYECLSGDLPFSGSYAQVIAGVVSPRPAPSIGIAAPHVIGAFVGVVDRALAKKRADRFANAGELATAIREALPRASTKTTLLLPHPLKAVGSPDLAQQRRRNPRTPYNTPVRLSFANGALDARTEDISAGGVLLISRTQCAANQRGSLRFALPMDGKVVSVDIEVRWVRDAEGHGANGLRAIGAEFLSPAPHVIASIAQYVELMREKGGA